MQTPDSAPALEATMFRARTLQGLSGPSLLVRLGAMRGDPQFTAWAGQELTPESYAAGRWCLSDLIRLTEDEGRIALEDHLLGIEGRLSEQVREIISPGTFRLRLVHDAPLPISCSAPPRGARMLRQYGASKATVDGAGTHSPSSHKEQILHVLQPGVVLDLPIHGDRPWQSALHLLRQWGWSCRLGGSPRRRYIQKNDRAHRGAPDRLYEEDRWRIVEEAFCAMHPDEAPTARDVALGHKHYLPIAANAVGDVERLRGELDALRKQIAEAAPGPARASAPEYEAELAALRAENERLKSGGGKRGAAASPA